MHDPMIDFETVTPDLWSANEQAWKERLLKLPNWYQIPLLNSNASHNLPDNTLVRFRGMIQDMHNPEFYFDKFEVLNMATKEIKNKSGKYRDTANILEHEKINYTENLISGERQTMVVVSIPGLNDWAKNLENSNNHLKHLEDQPNTSKRLDNSLKFKRTFDEADEDCDAMDVVENEVKKEPKKVMNEDKNEPKRAESVDAAANGVSIEHLLNFPLPDVPSKSCIVKIYEENDKLKLNEMVEVVGFLSVDPALSGEFLPEKNSLVEPELETDVETITHNPPPSLVPRLHAVHVKILEHCNPLVKDDFDQGAVLQDANSAREHLLKALTELLLGDKLAAEYLICHLIASIYQRQDTIVLGKFCLSFCNMPIEKYPEYGQQLYEIIKQFVTKSYYLPVTIDNLNTLSFLPKKDYDCNRLTSGILQLSKHTHLVIDETKLSQGQLNEAGVNNVLALGTLIQTQKVEYDFKFYKMGFDTDISVLILSEGKSLFPCDFQVPLRPEESSLKIFDAIVEATSYYLKEDIMNKIRIYLSHIKLVKYTISEDLQFIEDDFIELRSKGNRESQMDADALHRLLVLARLVCLSTGLDTLNKDCWDTAKYMEEQRLLRVRRKAGSNERDDEAN